MHGSRFSPVITERPMLWLQQPSQRPAQKQPPHAPKIGGRDRRKRAFLVHQRPSRNPTQALLQRRSCALSSTPPACKLAPSALSSTLAWTYLIRAYAKRHSVVLGCRPSSCGALPRRFNSSIASRKLPLSSHYSEPPSQRTQNNDDGKGSQRQFRGRS
jgi:hypothetical protein